MCKNFLEDSSRKDILVRSQMKSGEKNLQENMDRQTIIAVFLLVTFASTFCSELAKANGNGTPPVADFSYTPSWPRVCSVVTFNASSSEPEGGTIVEYKWEFGDGNITSTTNVTITHHYTSQGIYNATLTVLDSEGLKDTTWKAVNVRAPPIADFTHAPLEPTIAETVSFDASASKPGGGTIVLYRWNFGDGNVSGTPEAAITHVYWTRAAYNVTLTIFDDEDMNDTTWKLVNVITHDVAIVSVTPEADWVYQGKPCHSNVNVTVINIGDTTETFNVTILADYNLSVIGDEYVIGVHTVTLTNGSSVTLTTLWETSEVEPCRNYTVTALASEVPHEINSSNNIMTGEAAIKVRLVGDVNGDGLVDIRDIALATFPFGERPGRPRWLPYGPYADINNDEMVDVRDLAIIAGNFGRRCP